MIIVIKLHIKLEKKNTKASIISSFRKIFNKDQNTKLEISIHWKKSIHKKSKLSKKVMKNITLEKPKNFQIIKSFLFIGLLKIKKIVFHSISLNKSWLQINKIQISQKISIIDNQKSIIILFVSQIVNSANKRENKIKINQKKTII